MNLLIIQARMNSTRLPGKVLKKINGKTLLEIQLNRIKDTKNIDKIIIATTVNKSDDIIEQFCIENNIQCYRGDEKDVLDRFYKASCSLTSRQDTIVRITSDCPLHSCQVIDFCINEFYKLEVDYFSNSNNPPLYLEDGFDVEVISFGALETAWKEAKLQSEREHVTPYIKNCGKYKCSWKKAHPEYNYKLSVDTRSDFLAIKSIISEIGDNPFFTIEDVVKLLKQKPEILLINADSEINSGYKHSLKKDKIANFK